ncbi:hypothetical protein THAOC_25537 [Thalassiosira oceanica]|uniref:Uncharacterized protein n=1 Tax=Thalassiosira oceanica TaxID=159749 RepID=K0RR03_THAOC|nr:hypothetical protein THAOC_25537 [Thalassiosira oceanica]|eukprot:EJK54804.1 hypothetical protein THAOC_25537 [Thalassiosira oceanica]
MPYGVDKRSNDVMKRAVGVGDWAEGAAAGAAGGKTKGGGQQSLSDLVMKKPKYHRSCFEEAQVHRYQTAEVLLTDNIYPNGVFLNTLMVWMTLGRCSGQRRGLSCSAECSLHADGSIGSVRGLLRPQTTIDAPTMPTIIDLLAPIPASGVRGNDGVYPARPSALHTPTGPFGRSVASVDLEQPSMTDAADNHRSVSSDFTKRANGSSGEGACLEEQSARFGDMSSDETAATEFNDSVGRSGLGRWATTYTKCPLQRPKLFGHQEDMEGIRLCRREADGLIPQIPAVWAVRTPSSRGDSRSSKDRWSPRARPAGTGHIINQVDSRL